MKKGKLDKLIVNIQLIINALKKNNEIDTFLSIISPRTFAQNVKTTKKQTNKKKNKKTQHFITRKR